MNIDKKLAFDIGAYIGDSIQMIRGLGYTDIICFEPAPHNFKALFNTFGNDKDITCIQKAISDKSGKTEMIINPDLPFLNTIEKYWTEDCRHVGYYNKSNMHKVEIDTISLNEFIESIGRIPDYIKLDAEGHGFKILKNLNYKSSMLSFEWVSEFEEVNNSCLDSLNKLGFNQFIICFMEATPKINDIKLNYIECKNQLKEIKNNDIRNELWGNIWAL